MWYFLTLCALVLRPKGAWLKDARHCVHCEPAVFLSAKAPVLFFDKTKENQPREFLPGPPGKRCHCELQATCNFYFIL